MSGLWSALLFLTSVPFPGGRRAGRADLGRAAPWFPLVGLILGALLSLLWWLLAGRLPSLVSGVLVVTAWALLTGGLHLDGLADCCDGLLVSAPRARRMEILRDARLGAFGGAGLTLALMLKLSAVAALRDPRALLLAPLLGRAALVLGGLQRQARPGGMGAQFAGELTRGRAAAALLVAAVAAIAFAWPGVVSLAVALTISLATFALARRRLGGVTGDVLGAACELSEVGVLLVWIARWN